MLQATTAAAANRGVFLLRGKHNDGCRLAAAAAAVSALGLAAAAVSSNQNDQHRALCQAPANDATSFQVMAALEVKEELEKVRLAQLIHDLHTLAKERQQQSSSEGKKPAGGLRRYVTMVGAAGKNEAAATKKQLTKRKLSSGRLTSAKVQSNGEIVADFLDSIVTSSTTQSLIKAILQADGKLSKDSLVSLVQACQVKLEEEPSLIDLTKAGGDTVTVVGDLHGNLQSLSSILQLVGVTDLDKQNRTIVFNGDFVDRGAKSLEVICILLLLKLAYPKQVILLRGNHEDDLIASVYGFRDEIREKYGLDAADDIWKAITELFAALPIAAKTKTAAIWHGGLPGKYFELEHIAAISLAQRSSLLSTAVVDGAVSELAQGLLWSDPDANVDMLVPNPRGCGVTFGPSVAKSFLEREGLQYLIRSHEVVQEGVGVMKCGKQREVITVFSTAGYPDGEGENKGAILHLRNDEAAVQDGGGYTVDKFASDCPLGATGGDATAQGLRSMITANRALLEKAFTKSQDFWGQVSVEQWAEIMGRELEMPQLNWKKLQPTMAPASAGLMSSSVDWKAFLKGYETTTSGKGADALQANHQMLLTVFKFLDEDGSGSVDMDEFRNGVKLLNDHLPEKRQLKDADSLFKMLDADGNGAIDIAEFQQLFSVL